MSITTRIGIIREAKHPADKRTPFSPEQCRRLKAIYPQLDVLVQPSSDRCFSDEAYEAEGITVSEDLSACDFLLGIKEVPAELLLHDKTYLFFSHTIKKQPHNRNLLRAILEKKIRLVDYECLTWENGSRILGFGRFAGIVGTHNGLLTWGEKTGAYHLTPAWKTGEYAHLLDEYAGISLPPMRICLTGDGRVAHGALELLQKIGIREVTNRAYLNDTFSEPVYVHLRSEDYYEHKEHRPFDKGDFYHNPEDYYSVFRPFAHATDLLINAIFWAPGIPPFFSKEEMKDPRFAIKAIADISCDIPGSLPSTIRATTIDAPVYGYHPFSEKETKAFQPNAIDVMAVGNLPCELPKDASLGFGEDLIRSVIPQLMADAPSDIIARATIAYHGVLSERYQYLSDFVA